MKSGRRAAATTPATASSENPITSTPVAAACARRPGRTPLRATAQVNPRNASAPTAGGIGSRRALTAPTMRASTATSASTSAT